MTTERGTGASRTAGARHQRRPAWTLALTGAFLVVEVAGGLWTGSLALLADAGHMLTDVAAIALSLPAELVDHLHPSTSNGVKVTVGLSQARNKLVESMLRASTCGRDVSDALNRRRP